MKSWLVWASFYCLVVAALLEQAIPIQIAERICQVQTGVYDATGLAPSFCQAARILQSGCELPM